MHNDERQRPRNLAECDNRSRLDAAARKMTAASRFLHAAAGLAWSLGKLALLAAGVVLIASIGRGLLGRAPAGSASKPLAPPRTVAAPAPLPWDQVDAAVAQAAATARGRAEQYAAAELETWTADLMTRVDEDFLPWYFGYFNQQRMGLNALYQGSKGWLAAHFTSAEIPTAGQWLIEEFEREFAARVLRPEVAQMRMERITRQAVQLYLEELRRGLEVVQVRYQIPQPEWDRYLESVGTSVSRFDGNRQVPLTLKAITASTAGGAVVLARSLGKAAGRIEVRLTARAAEQSVEKIATRTGSKVAARAGGRFLGPLIAAAVIAWDVWDHHRTVSQNRPVLRQSLQEYLTLLQDHLLRDPQTGVLAAVYGVEAEIVRAATSRDGSPSVRHGI